MRRAKYLLYGIDGPGLLILRLTLAIELSNDAVSRLHLGSPSFIGAAIGEFVLSGLVLLGLLTPFVAALSFALQVLLLAGSYRTAEVSLVLAGISLSISALGGGPWSVDARLFGLRRVEIKNSRTL